ncbi:hypothetical protein Aperf_G00000033073 [Anoplocephala perfoliata]
MQLIALMGGILTRERSHASFEFSSFSRGCNSLFDCGDMRIRNVHVKQHKTVHIEEFGTASAQMNSDDIKLFSRSEETVFRKCERLIASCFLEEMTTALYELFEISGLFVQEIEFWRVSSYVDRSVLMDHFGSSSATACAVIYACGRSTAFKRACCLLRRQREPCVSEYSDMVQQFSRVWFGVSLDNLTQLDKDRNSQSRNRQDRNLFEHFYRGHLKMLPGGCTEISGMHWGCLRIVVQSERIRGYLFGSNLVQ